METELKFQISDQERIADFKSPTFWARLGYEMVEPVSLNMQAVYFDTTDRLFSAMKVSVRLRQEANRRVLTVKSPVNEDLKATDPSFFQRQEWEWLLSESNSYDQVEHLVSDLLNQYKASFSPEIQAVIDRNPKIVELYRASFTRYRAALKTPDQLLELAIDQGELIGLYGRSPIQELELELKEGSIQDLEDLPKILLSERGLDIQPLSKAARLYQLSTYDFIVIGGGAAGLMAAIAYQEKAPDHKILILESENRLARKLAASGNGRGNLTNINLTEANYHSVSTTDRSLVQAQLAKCSVGNLIAYFAQMGLYTRVEDGRVYPYSYQAKSIVDSLEHALAQHKTTDIRLNTKVTGLRRFPSVFAIDSNENERFYARKVLIATGGEASPKLGSDGSLYPILDRLGHKSSPRYPGLVQMVAKGLPKRMVGQRIHASLSLYSNEKCIAEDYGEILLTDYGLSGIPVLNLSQFAAQEIAAGRTVEARVNLLADLDPDLQRSFIEERVSSWPETEVESFAVGLLGEKIAAGLCVLAGIEGQKKLAELTEVDKRNLQELCVALPLKVSDTKGFQFAQVSCGGIPCEEVDPQRLESRLVEDLYFAGEVLDVHGDCGGFNLNFAFITGMQAAYSAAE